jgi:hypothetical protein
MYKVHIYPCVNPRDFHDRDYYFKSEEEAVKFYENMKENNVKNAHSNYTICMPESCEIDNAENAALNASRIQGL